MSELKVLIVDDEKLARQKIKRFLSELAPESAVKEAANGIEAVAGVKSFAPDIVFLDIQMPGLNGFEVLDHFIERPFAVIFQTAFDEFASRCFLDVLFFLLRTSKASTKSSAFWVALFIFSE